LFQILVKYQIGDIVCEPVSGFLEWGITFGAPY